MFLITYFISDKKLLMFQVMWKVFILQDIKQNLLGRSSLMLVLLVWEPFYLGIILGAFFSTSFFMFQIQCP